MTRRLAVVAACLLSTTAVLAQTPPAQDAPDRSQQSRLYGAWWKASRSTAA